MPNPGRNKRGPRSCATLTDSGRADVLSGGPVGRELQGKAVSGIKYCGQLEWIKENQPVTWKLRDKWPSLLHLAAMSRQADEGEGQRVGIPLKNSGSFEGRRRVGAQRTPILFGQ